MIVEAMIVAAPQSSTRLCRALHHAVNFRGNALLGPDMAERLRRREKA
jgi:hypothetical protein